ncbi:SDR family NAD(P)-dependent oxidoreductase [Oceanobacillus neutriphilus]|uniref:SDR family oxidoreductase n=1 Tax=Oceanobacillus neutriphilus TaxID=531815 RepID=A0ABQ2NR99_9BACI|nr:SDR family oxidoreductase [Oceanobacillus neutriphilus]GGP09277.1 hypothetical protein GCM10011346_12700 [Oceanobacillus neutriphilus]
MNILLFDASHRISGMMTAYYQTVYALDFTDKLNGKGSLYQYINGQDPVQLISFDLLDDQDVSMESWLNKNNIQFDTVINNLEHLNGNTLTETSVDEWQKSLFINLHLPFLLIKAFISYVPDDGQIIHISSTVAVSGETGDVSYASHKSGLESFSKSLSKELSKRNIRSNVISISPKCWRNPEGARQIIQLLKETCNEHMSFLNGQVITLDNGETLS